MATETPQESSVNMVSHMDLNKTACKIIEEGNPNAALKKI